MKTYFRYFINCFKNETAYKVDWAMNTALTMVFFLIYFFLWKSVYQQNSLLAISGYSLSNTITYYFVTSFIYKLDLTGAIYFNQNVWDGYFTNDLIKPWNIRITVLIEAMNDLFMSTLIYIPFGLFMYWIAKDFISLPTLPNAVLFLITLFLSILMNFAFNMILHSLVFYFGDQEPNINLVNFTAGFFAGGMFPLAFLPELYQRFFEILPFRFLFDVPTNIYMGRLSSSAIYSSWIQIIIWTIIFYLIFCLLLKNGLKRYTGTGR